MLRGADCPLPGGGVGAAVHDVLDQQERPLLLARGMAAGGEDAARRCAAGQDVPAGHPERPARKAFKLLLFPPTPLTEEPKRAIHHHPEVASRHLACKLSSCKSSGGKTSEYAPQQPTRRCCGDPSTESTISDTHLAWISKQYAHPLYALLQLQVLDQVKRGEEI